jgi:hypothetical protein
LYDLAACEKHFCYLIRAGPDVGADGATQFHCHSSLNYLTNSDRRIDFVEERGYLSGLTLCTNYGLTPPSTPPIA